MRTPFRIRSLCVLARIPASEFHPSEHGPAAGTMASGSIDHRAGLPRFENSFTTAFPSAWFSMRSQARSAFIPSTFAGCSGGNTADRWRLRVQVARI